MSYIEKKLEQKVEEFYVLGRLAKQLSREGKQQEEVDEIYIQMAQICHELRAVELVFKALYPVLSELSDQLIKLYNTRKI